MKITSPNLIVPGAAKSGTSSLHFYLNQHPLINMSKIKEPHVYSFEERYKNRFRENTKFGFENNYDWFKDYQFRGESSTSYFLEPNVPHRIFGDNPNCKFIFILRDPIDRLISNYNWLFTFGVIEKRFEEEIKDWIGIPYDINRDFKGNYKNYLDKSLYASNISRFLEHFNRKDIHIIEFEELVKNTVSTMNSVYTFLGLHEFFNLNLEIKNQTLDFGYQKQPTWLNAKFFNVKGLRSFKKWGKHKFAKTVYPEKINDTDINFLFKYLNPEVQRLKNEFGFEPKNWKSYNG